MRGTFWMFFFGITLGILTMSCGPELDAKAGDVGPLQLEEKIGLGNVRGRLDHMALDIDRHRLFVAELGNDSVGVVDLRVRRIVRRIVGLKGPQGVGYVPTTDTLYVANGGDGLVRLFQGADYSEAGGIELRSDADNLRVDPAASRVIVGYGNGGLAIVDPASRKKVNDVSLKAHPESFQLDPDSSRTFINLPSARAIAVVDRFAGIQIARWPMTAGHANFPMALDTRSKTVIVVFRDPPRLGAFSMRDGSSVANVETCSDSDDVFVDTRRRRLYVSCGDGYLDVFNARGDGYDRIAHIRTAVGARTALYAPELDRLLLGVRADAGRGAEIWMYRPTP